MKNFRAIAPIPFVLLALASPAHAQPYVPYTMQIVFGDSLSDGGNAYNKFPAFNFPPSPPYNQRATNGLTGVEYLSRDYLGETLKPSLPAAGGGNNYAYIGAATGYYNAPNPTNPPAPIPPYPPGTVLTTDNYSDWRYGLPYLRNTGLGNQVDAFDAANLAFDPAKTLFTVFAGANDVFLGLESGAATPQQLVFGIAGNLTAAITELAGLGARHFLVPNMPNLGLTPAFNSNPADISELAQLINLAMATSLTALESSLKLTYADLNIVQFDTYGLLTQLVAQPPAGVTNTTQACLNLAAGTMCSNPDAYLFWDGVHPTAVTHKAFAEAFAYAVPEPETWLLFGLGFGLLLARGRTRPALAP
jgi:phospholipase/lecithinase/hemolysin